jgi:hypothetical protein
MGESMTKRLVVGFAAFTFLFLKSYPAYAYIDPGTGSIVTTAILGAFAALAYTIRLYLARFREWFNAALGRNRATADERSEGEQD